MRSGGGGRREAGREAETDQWLTPRYVRATLRDAERCLTMLCGVLHTAPCPPRLSPREGTFFWAVLVQVYCKVVAIKAHKAKKASGSKEPFNRYTDEYMLAADRGVGNWLEWAPSFILLFWLNALFTGENVSLGWVYVASRAAYPLLALMGGIKTSGAKGPIFLSTLPGYAVLFKYAYDVYMAVR